MPRTTPTTLPAIRGTLICSLVVLVLDVIISGSYLFAALVCPIWFLVSLVRTIAYRPSLRVAAVRLLFPLLTLLVVVANSSLQNRIAMRSAARLIQACNAYHAATGAYPDRLTDLVPRYVSSIPPAKYCLAFGEFSYFGPPHPMLVWCELPPFGRHTYGFEDATWKYLD